VVAVCCRETALRAGLPSWGLGSSRQPVPLNNRMDQKLPSMALDSGIPAGMTSFGCPHILLCITMRAGAWETAGSRIFIKKSANK